jgi:HlyD family secretion protein
MSSRTWVLLATTTAAVTAIWVGRAALGGRDERLASTSPAERDEVVAPGRVEGPSEIIDLGFEQSGRIVSLPVNEGDRVTRNQVVARIDDRLARARVARAEAALAGARARRDAALRGARAEEIRAAEAEADMARAQSRNDTAERARGDRLLGAKAISPAEAERLRSGAETAIARARAAEARLAVVREGTRGELQRAASAEVAAAEAELEETRLLLAQTEISAPTDGVVLRRRAEVGEQVSLVPPTVVLTIANLDHLQLRAEVDEEDVARVAAGQIGFARADGYGDRRFPGRVVRTMRELGRKAVLNDDPRARVDTRVLEVIFQFDANPDLPLGLRMELHVPAAPALRR